jgi:predicted DCC family thiol-disulfide oxidoreductase YuxK
VSTRRPALLIYDGDCGFCTASARWTKRGWSSDARIVAYQELGESGLEDLGLSVRDAEQAAWWVDEAGELWRGHRAIAKALQASAGSRRAVGLALDSPVLSPLGALAYRLTVRYRHKLPGATDACRTGDQSATRAKV